MKSKSQKALVLRGISLAVSFCLVVVCGIILFNRSVAWFSQNKTVGANGASVSLADLGITGTYYAKRTAEDAYTEITDWAHIFDGLCPGEAVYIRTVYENTSDQAHSLRLFFGLTDSGEVPKVTEGAYYYFSTQLKVTDVSVNGTATSNEAFLLTPPDNRLYYTAEQTMTDTHVADFSLGVGETATVDFAVLFVNYDDLNQNAYQGFGQGSETCSRCPIVYVD